MTEQTELLREMRDLLIIMAEPALAKRDERFRKLLRQIVGSSKPKAKAVLLMDGSRSQTAIKNESGIDAGNLSRCVKELKTALLIGKDEKQNPKLVISIPPNFFEKTGDK
jgi:predicted transcriptional regulator